MLSLNDAMLKKQTGAGVRNAEWDALEPEEQIVRAIIEGREENHLTQEQLADVTGIHQTNISKLESGTANPSLRTLKRLAAGMGTKAQAGLRSRAARFQRKITALFPRHRTSVSFSGRPALFL